jgi:hypothetical protein
LLQAKPVANFENGKFESSIGRHSHAKAQA